jgi:RNA polymerase sigma factor (sigma-70 family)
VEAFDNVLFAARSGAEWAWERIYAELAPGVRGYLRANGATDLDDLVSEVFLQIVRGLDGFAGNEPAFRGWVYTIAHRRLVDELRRRSRRPSTPVEPAALSDASRAGGDVEDEALASLDADRVRQAIEGLPPDQRAVLLLRIIGDLTIEQIAMAVGKKPGAVKALQRRGLRRLEGAYPFPELQR